MRSYIRPVGGASRAPGHHGHLRTKGQSLNRASKANPAIGLVSCRSDRHAMNAFFAALSSGEAVYAADGRPAAASKSMSRDHTTQMIRASLLATAIAALFMAAPCRKVDGPLLKACDLIRRHSGRALRPQ